MKVNNPEELQRFFLEFKAGAESGYKYFYDLFHRPAYFLVRNIIRDEAAAQDIVQESFTILFSRRDIITDVKHLENYVNSTARHKALRQLVVRKQELSAEKLWSTYEYEWSFQAIDAKLQLERILNRISHEKDGLPEKRREVFILRHVEHMEVKEIARKLKIAETTVYTHLNKAYIFIAKAMPDMLLVLFILFCYTFR